MVKYERHLDGTLKRRPNGSFIVRPTTLQDIDEKIRPLYTFLNSLPGIRTIGSCQGHPDSENFKNAYITFLCSDLRTLGMLASFSVAYDDPNEIIESRRDEIPHLNALWIIGVLEADDSECDPEELNVGGYYVSYCLSPDSLTYANHNAVYDDIEELVKYYETKLKRVQYGSAERLDYVLKILKENEGTMTFSELCEKFARTRYTTKKKMWYYLDALKSAKKIDYPEKYPAHREGDVKIVLLESS